MQTNYCSYCGYQIYNNQSWERDNAGFKRHVSWDDCSVSMAKGDGKERDGEIEWKHLRRRYAGLHY